MSNAVLLYIALVAPVILLLFLLKKELRLIFLFYVIGATICLACGEINSFIMKATEMSQYDMTINITPVIEELIKAMPLFFIAFVLSCKDKTLLMSGVSLGVGFAVLETVIGFVGNVDAIDAGWAIMRGLGAGLVHSLSGIIVSFGLIMVRRFKGAGVPIVIASLAVVILFHSSYNILVQSNSPWLALVLTLFAFGILVLIYFLKRDSFKEEFENE